MIDVLMYLYETYWRPDACPPPEQLTRKLSAAGFERAEIEEALNWLRGLAVANATAPAARILSSNASSAASSSAQRTQRIYTAQEQDALGIEGTNIIAALERQGKLSAQTRELLIERALASGQHPMDSDDLKVMLLIVFWSLDEEPDPLVLDELFEDPEQPRTYH